MCLYPLYARGGQNCVLHSKVVFFFFFWGNANGYLYKIINNSFKESFYRKKKINVLTTFFISHKSGVKIFLK